MYCSKNIYELVNTNNRRKIVQLIVGYSIFIRMMDRYARSVSWWTPTRSLWVVIVLQSSVSAALQTTCSLCGELGPDTLPARRGLPPRYNLPVYDCFDLETVALVLPEASELCVAMQALRAYCGCNLSPDRCTLCWDGSPPPNRETILENYQVTDFVAINGVADGVLLDCEAVDSFLQSLATTDSDQCSAAQLDVGELCGCPPLPNDTVVDNTNNQTDTTTNQNVTQPNQNTTNDPNQASDAVPRCTVCRNGEAPAFPDEILAFGVDLEFTCSEWDLFVSSVSSTSEDCSLLQGIGGSKCGCSPEPRHCSFCPRGETVPKPDQSLNWMENPNLSSSTSDIQSRMADGGFFRCHMMESFLASNHRIVHLVASIDEGLLCTAAQLKSWICGCAPDWKPIVLTWCYRLSAILSFVVSYNS